MMLICMLTLGPTLLTASRTTTKKNAPEIYVVQSGDSLYTIAKKCDVTLKALLKANDLNESALLHPGQKLRLPRGAKRAPHQQVADGSKRLKNSRQAPRKRSASPLQIYKVKAGDTLSVIAQEHKVPLKELLRANRMEPGALIRVGQALVIPAVKREKTPAKIASSTRAEKKSKKPTKKAQKGRKNKSNAPAVHVVAYGDTLFSIARKYKTPLKDLMALNGIQPTDVIHPGQELKIPGSSYRAKTAGNKEKKKSVRKGKKAPNAEPLIYTVKHGDTLWEIAHKHKVSIAQIRRLNKMKRKDVIRTGMKLVIKKGNQPTSAATLAKAKKKKEPRKIEKFYTVKKGDSLWLIAKRHKTSVAELRRLNGMKRGDVIHTGMKLKVGYEKVPPTRLAKKTKKKTKGKVAASKKKRPKQRVASKSGSRKKNGRKSADRRINSALAALNGKGGRRGGGGGDYNVIRTAKKYLGRRYVWGAEGPSSFDCSGFTQYVMRKSKGVKLPRVSRKQAYYGKYVTRSQLRPGDLVFFDTSRRRRGYVNHVGIYIGNGKFIHASSARHRVVITSLNSPFYRARFKWGRRVN
jgi:LysM repeat protein